MLEHWVFAVTFVVTVTYAVLRLARVAQASAATGKPHARSRNHAHRR